jgi:hypothetical protein
MTNALPFTQASIKRRIDAVRKAGLFVIGVTTDGTVLTGDNPAGLVTSRPMDQDNAEPRLRDAREKFGSG